MHTALVISGISREAQMPRPNRLEVTPLHAQAKRSQTKARRAALGSLLEPHGFVDVLRVCQGITHSLVMTHSCVDTCLSTSARNWLQPFPWSSSLSRKTVFGDQARCQNRRRLRFQLVQVHYLNQLARTSAVSLGPWQEDGGPRWSWSQPRRLMGITFRMIPRHCLLH